MNHKTLIHLMERYRVSIKMVCEMLDKSPATIKQWRCVSGQDISNDQLDDLAKILAERYPYD